MTNDIPNPPEPPPPPAEPTPPLPPPPPAQPNAPMEPEAPSIFQIWMDALTKPYESTYAAIARSPRANATNAFLWVFLATLLQFFVAFLVGSVARNQIMQRFGFGQDFGAPSLGGRIGTLICGAPIAAVIAVLFFALFVGITQLIARAFGGRGTFSQMAFVAAAIVVPVNLIQTALNLLGAIPFIGLCFNLISILLGLYALVLLIVAVMGVHQIGLLGALVSVLVLPFVACICAACAAAAGAAALGPIIGNIFRNSGGNPFPFPLPTP
jgi:hypothetical protein